MCRKLTTDEFIKRSSDIHGNKYDYSLSVYTKGVNRLYITCPLHGLFFQRADVHLRGHSCPVCAIEKCCNIRTDISNISPPFGSKIIALTHNKYTIVDEEDYERLIKHRWMASIAKNNYILVSTWIKGKTVIMSRFIMNETRREVVIDHIDHDSLNNRKSNLRKCTQHENTLNSVSKIFSSSKYLGVSLSKNKKRWVAAISINRKHTHIGTFDNEEDAARAYDELALKHRKEFANPNFKS